MNRNDLGKPMRQVSTRIGRIRVAPLSAALALGLGLSALPMTSALASALDVSMPATWKAGDGSGVAALMHSLHDVAAVRKRAGVAHVAATLQVSNCADDSSPGSLREVVAAAGEGDTLDLSQLQCSVITLSQGAIPVMLDTLTLLGPGADRLAIDGAGLDRVFVHYGYDTLVVQGLTVRHGLNQVSGYHVAGGACIVGNGYVTLDHSVVSGCTSIGEGAYGGGILARGVTLYSSTLSGNVALGSHPNTFTAAYGGGAMAYRGTAALYDSTVSGNRAAHELTDINGSYCSGGGIFADSGGYASSSTISQNYSYGTGGGIASHAGFFVSQSTISGNTAHGKNGGGMFVRLFDSMSINNTTITQNTAVRGGGIYLAGLPQGVVLRSTLVANNAATAGADIAAQNALALSGTTNLVRAVDNASLPGDTLNANPALLPLADNGGPTLTHALSVASPALDAGSNVLAFTFDQRGSGFPRALGAAADIGAFEGALAAPDPVAVGMLSSWVMALLAAMLGGIGVQEFTTKMRNRARTS